MTLSHLVWYTFSRFRLKFTVVVLFFYGSQKRRTALNFRLDFLIKKGKVGVWFIIYLMKNVYVIMGIRIKNNWGTWGGDNAKKNNNKEKTS